MIRTKRIVSMLLAVCMILSIVCANGGIFSVRAVSMDYVILEDNFENYDVGVTPTGWANKYTANDAATYYTKVDWQRNPSNGQPIEGGNKALWVWADAAAPDGDSTKAQFARYSFAPTDNVVLEYKAQWVQLTGAGFTGYLPGVLYAGKEESLDSGCFPLQLAVVDKNGTLQYQTSAGTGTVGTMDQYTWYNFRITIDLKNNSMSLAYGTDAQNMTQVDLGDYTLDANATLDRISAGIYHTMAGAIAIDDIKVTTELNVDFAIKNYTLEKGKTQALVPTIAPAVDCDISYKSNDEEVVTVDENGLMTAVAVGKTTITATPSLGGAPITLNVQVIPERKNLLVQDFENEEGLAGWTEKQDNVDQEKYYAKVEADGDNKVFHVHNDFANINTEGYMNFFMVQRTFEEAANVELEYRFKYDASNAGAHELYLPSVNYTGTDTPSDPTDAKASPLKLNISGNMLQYRFGSADAVSVDAYTLSEDTWYTIKMSIDLRAGTRSLYWGTDSANLTEIVTTATADTDKDWATATLDRISMGNYTWGGDIYVDDIRLSTRKEADYAVELVKSSTDLVAVGDPVTLKVNVNKAFNSSKIVLAYDPEYLEFKSAESGLAQNQEMGNDDVDVAISGENGVITIVDYGTEFAAGTAYTLNFTAKAATAGTDVTFTSAGFSTAEQAKTEDLNPALVKTPVTVPVGYTVTVPTTQPHVFAASAEKVLPGGSVDITGGSAHYDYVLAATGGILAETETGWTVSEINGNVDVTISSSVPHTYDVTVRIVDENGDPVGEDVVTENDATHDKDYEYTEPADVPAGLQAGTKYTLQSITVGGAPATYDTEGDTHTIAGANVTGDIVITVKKETVAPSNFTVDLEGAASDGTLENTVVTAGGTAKLTLNKETGYNYEVTATMGGTPVEGEDLVVSDNVYTIDGVSANVVFIITKTLDTSKVYAAEYLAFDNDASDDLYLVYIDAAVIDGKTYQYNGQNFFYSDKGEGENAPGYDAYCLLVKAESDVAAVETVKADLSLVDGDAIQITYTGDVNKTGVVDINDAQLVWNMYNNSIEYFTSANMEKYLRADVGGGMNVNSADAVAVVGLAK